MPDFRTRVREWLAENLPPALVGTGGPGREHEHIEARLDWERQLAAGGWIGLGWPSDHGGRASIADQVVFYEEYARAGGPGRLSHIGEYLLAPTLIAYGTPEQQDRFLPPIARAEEFWCQGYSEPDAGSYLAAVRSTATLDGDRWHITGQKVWTSLAHHADWCFVLARTSVESTRHKGLSYLLVPMRQPGIEVRPIVQLTGTSEFNEVFFDDAVTDVSNVVGSVGDGWRVATGTLGFERGVATLGQQLGFARELETIIASAPTLDAEQRSTVVDAWVGLQTLRHHALRTLCSPPAGPSASIAKLLWAPWHRHLGELALELGGPAATVVPSSPYDLTDAQRLFLFTRADTIYGGSDEIQRGIIANHLLGRG